ncbi:MAG: hypothetical protein M3256_19415, partial [Actinomycetota bacterium]|nr:hypothetical protein [Actinomycetota bacterium]
MRGRVQAALPDASRVRTLGQAVDIVIEGATLRIPADPSRIHVPVDLAPVLALVAAVWNLAPALPTLENCPLVLMAPGAAALLAIGVISHTLVQGGRAGSAHRLLLAGTLATGAAQGLIASYT